MVKRLFFVIKSTRKSWSEYVVSQIAELESIEVERVSKFVVGLVLILDLCPYMPEGKFIPGIIFKLIP